MIFWFENWSQEWTNLFAVCNTGAKMYKYVKCLSTGFAAVFSQSTEARC